MRCFLIDDDREDRDIFLGAVQERFPAVECRTAFDGENAIDQLRDGSYIPEIIFLDLNMPRMNGMECLRLIRSIHQLDNTKVVAFTTSTDPKDAELTKALGANDFVTKPSDFDSLIETLTSLLET